MMEKIIYKVWISVEKETSDPESGGDTTLYENVGLPELLGEYESEEDARDAAETALFSADE